MHRTVSQMAFGKTLLALEGIWVLLFISLGITALVITDGPPFDGAVGENMRDDAFNLGRHIILSGVLLSFIGVKRPMPTRWLVPLVSFIFFGDIYNLVSIVRFTPLKNSDVLWGLALTTAIWQLVVTILTIFWLVYLYAWGRKTTRDNGFVYLTPKSI